MELKHNSVAGVIDRGVFDRIHFTEMRAKATAYIMDYAEDRTYQIIPTDINLQNPMRGFLYDKINLHANDQRS